MRRNWAKWRKRTSGHRRRSGGKALGHKIGQTLSGASQNVTTDTDDLINDVSDEDTEEDVEGKVTNCINEGNVNADINAGGITGAMARENDLDPEDDFTIDGSQSLNFT